jgi:hypothetical protein
MPFPPQEHLLLKDALPKDIKFQPPRPNETLVSVNTNRLGEVTYAKYTMSAPWVVLDGVRATPGQVRFIPPRETLKRSAPALVEREEKHQRTTITMLEKRIDLLSQTVMSIQH